MTSREKRQLNADECRGFELGSQSVLNELWNAIAELEATRGKSSYGRGQLYVLRELVQKMDLEGGKDDQ